jgi:hypothetical protein
VPYVHCPSCDLRTYTAAAWLDADHCPHCATPLKRVDRPGPQQRHYAAFVDQTIRDMLGGRRPA